MMRAHTRRLLAAALATLGVLAAGLAFTGAPAFAAAPEAPETTSPTGVTATKATLHGVLNPKALTPVLTGWYFAYNIGSTCTGGPTTPLEPEVAAQAKAQEKEASELQPNSKYVSCLVATDEGGAASTQGNEVPFTTPSAPPTLVAGSESASATSTSATLQAQVNANNEATTYSFEYATDKALTGAKTIKGAAALEGYGNQTASVSTGAVLLPSETYYYRVVAENEQSEKEGMPTSGPVEEFTTVPTPHTEEAKSVTATTATFNGALTPLSSVEAEYFFDYRIGSECAGENSTPRVSAGKGSGSKAVSTAVSELQPSESYSVCLVSANAFGSEVDPATPPVHFTTPPAPPTVPAGTESAENVTSFEAGLFSQLNPNNQETTYSFEYSTQAAGETLEEPITKIDGKTIPAGQYGNSEVFVPTGHVLAAGTTYYFRIVATNTTGTTKGKVVSFTTPGPVATTGAASAVELSSANVAGTVNSEGVETYYYYQYGTSTEYGQSTSPSEPGIDIGAGASPVQAPASLFPLVPGVTYHYRLVAWNIDGTSYGQDKTFTTEAGLSPLVTIDPASGITVDEATLSGTVNPQGKETSYSFEYGEGTEYGTQTFGTILAGQGVQSVTFNLSGIHADTTYHYRLKVSNAGGTAYSEDMTFTTLPIAFPVIAPPPPTLLALPSFTFPTGTEAGNTGKTQPHSEKKKHTKKKNKKKDEKQGKTKRQKAKSR